MLTVLATLGFVLGLRLSAGVAPLAAAAAFLTLRPFTPSWRCGGCRCSHNRDMVHVGAYLLANAFFDNSWDGLAYHQVGVLRLASGWNPLFEYANEIWVDHYPKASWIAGAAVFLDGGQIEAGKLFNFTLMLAAGAQVAATLFRLTRLRLPAIILISLLTALNPVAVYQSTTFYVDGALASLLTVMVAALILYAATPTWSALAASLFAACLLSNLKFTGLIYVANLSLRYRPCCFSATWIPGRLAIYLSRCHSRNCKFQWLGLCTLYPEPGRKGSPVVSGDGSPACRYCNRE